MGRITWLGFETLASTAVRSGIRLIAFEVAGAERRYPWQVSRQAEPFTWLTLFPNRALETVPRSVCGMRDGPGPY